jgi:hypothetical protein
VFGNQLLRFGGDVNPSQNNFAGLGAIGNAIREQAFPINALV